MNKFLLILMLFACFIACDTNYNKDYKLLKEGYITTQLTDSINYIYSPIGNSGKYLGITTKDLFLLNEKGESEIIASNFVDKIIISRIQKKTDSFIIIHVGIPKNLSNYRKKDIENIYYKNAVLKININKSIDTLLEGPYIKYNKRPKPYNDSHFTFSKDYKFYLIKADDEYQLYRNDASRLYSFKIPTAFDFSDFEAFDVIFNEDATLWLKKDEKVLFVTNREITEIDLPQQNNCLIRCGQRFYSKGIFVYDINFNIFYWINRNGSIQNFNDSDDEKQIGIYLDSFLEGFPVDRDLAMLLKDQDTTVFDVKGDIYDENNSWLLTKYNNDYYFENSQYCKKLDFLNSKNLDSSLGDEAAELYMDITRKKDSIMYVQNNRKQTIYRVTLNDSSPSKELELPKNINVNLFNLSIHHLIDPHQIILRNSFVDDNTSNYLYAINDKGQWYNNGYPISFKRKIYSTNLDDGIYLRDSNKFIKPLKHYDIKNPELDLENVSIDLSTLPASFFEDKNAEIKVRVFNSEEKEIALKPTLINKVIKDKKITIPYPYHNINEKIEPNKKYQIEVTLIDSNTSASFIFKNKIFKEDFFNTKTGKTILLLLGLLLFSMLIIKLSIFPVAVKKYIPLVIYVLSGLGTLYDGVVLKKLTDQFDATTFGIGVGILFIGGSILGVLKPYILRQLQSVAPFDMLHSALITIPAYKKRYYHNYIKDLNVVPDDADGDLGEESYVPIPATFTVGNSSTTEAKPVEALLAAVTSFENLNAPHVLIKAPGGQGKSALLRATFSAYKVAYEADPKLPVPIYLSGEQNENASVESMIRYELKSYADNPSFEKQLAKGEFILFFDGLSEAAIPKGVFETFVMTTNDLGQNMPIIATIRPNKVIEAEFRSSKNYQIVEPERLKETTVTTFVDQYLAEDKKLNPKLLEICKDDSGHYLPILVRLAVNLVNNSVATDIDKTYTINSLYKQFVKSMAKAKGGVIDEDLISISYGTYYDKGNRTILKTTKNKEKVEFAASSGLLVPIANKKFKNTETGRYRFLHDTIHTYLVSVEIYKKYLSPGDKFKDVVPLFYQLATKEIYRKDATSLFIKEGSEIFQMTILEFEDGETAHIKEQFKKALQKEIQTHKELLSVKNIKDCMPSKLKSTFQFTSDTPLPMHLELLEAIADDYLLISEYFHNFSILTHDLNEKN